MKNRIHKIKKINRRSGSSKEIAFKADDCNTSTSLEVEKTCNATTRSDLENPDYYAWKLRTVTNILDMMQAKQADYASHENPLSNFTKAEAFGIDPLIGLALRMSDKMSRLESFCKKGKLSVENESLEDIFKDLIGYSIIALAMLHEEEWEQSREDVE